MPPRRFFLYSAPMRSGTVRFFAPRPDGRCVILAAGDFPRKGGVPRCILESASKIVCCDGAADVFRRRMHRSPDAVVGDCDSLRGRFRNVVRIPEQETNDLEKAAGFCAASGWSDPVILGATGRRDDHSIGNVFRALSLKLEIVSESGCFVPLEGEMAFRVRQGAPVSVFVPDSRTRMKSRGLEWPLDGVRFDVLHRGTLNRAADPEIVLCSDRPVSVFFPSGALLLGRRTDI